MGALEQHNALRAKHENTPPMKLDSKMSKQAQEYAEEIARKQSLTHASASARTLDGEVCGENLAYAGGMFTSGEEEKAAIWASNAWYAEIVNYNWKTGEKNGKTEVARGQIGHFTQLVWDDSVKLGIGVAFNGSKVYVVARYLKHGNFRGQNLSHVHALKSGESPDPEPLKPETKSAVENGEDEKSEKKSKSKKKSRKSRKSKKSKKSKKNDDCGPEGCGDEKSECGPGGCPANEESKSKKSRSKSKKSRKSKKSKKSKNDDSCPGGDCGASKGKLMRNKEQECGPGGCGPDQQGGSECGPNGCGPDKSKNKSKRNKKSKKGKKSKSKKSKSKKSKNESECGPGGCGPDQSGGSECGPNGCGPDQSGGSECGPNGCGPDKSQSKSKRNKKSKKGKKSK